jgi:hypothetical protein
MKKIVVMLAVLCVLSSALFAEEWGKDEKLKRIDREIEEAKSSKKSGIIKVVAGIGCYALSFAFIPTTTYEYDSYSGASTNDEGSVPLYFACIGAGLVLEIWGGYQWWSAAQDLSHLKAKRYDITLYPTIKPEQVGLNLALKF